MAKIPEFTDNMEIIQNLSDYPEQDMLTTSQFKACFDRAGILIKTFLNRYVVPAINDYVASNDGLLSVEGGTMKGSIYMSGNRITGLGDPIVDSDSSTKKYADTKLPKSGGTMTGPISMGEKRVTDLANPSNPGDAANKSYVDGKHFTAGISLSSTGWAMSGGVYWQTVQVAGILETDRPHYGVVYSGTAEEMIAQKDGFALVDDLETAGGSVTVYCFDGTPEVDLNIQMEVNR